MTQRVLEPAEIDAALQSLREATASLGTSLFDIDALPVRTMIDPAALTGATAAAAATVVSVLATAWQHYPILTELVERCTTLRGAARIGMREREELSAVLLAHNPDGRTPVEAAEELCEQLDTARSSIQRIDDAWRVLIQRIGALGGRVAVVEELAGSLGEHPNMLTQVVARADVLRTATTTDPLGVEVASLDALEASIGTLERELGELRTKRDALTRNIAATGSQIGVLRARIAEGISAAERVRMRISSPRGSAALSLDLVDGPNGFRPRADALGATSDWRRAVRELDVWTSQLNECLRDARSVHDANMALLERRDQLRGRLDALKVKAARTGRSERADVDAAFSAAHDVLFSAPVDLDVAEKLVLVYGDIIGEHNNNNNNDDGNNDDSRETSADRAG